MDLKHKIGFMIFSFSDDIPACPNFTSLINSEKIDEKTNYFPRIDFLIKLAKNMNKIDKFTQYFPVFFENGFIINKNYNLKFVFFRSYNSYGFYFKHNFNVFEVLEVHKFFETCKLLNSYIFEIKLINSLRFN